LSESTVKISGGSLIQPGHELHRKVAHIFIKDGQIIEISAKPISTNADKEVNAEGCFILPGFMDLRCQLRDPGFEHQEDIRTGSAAAAASGFTALAVHPTTDPIVQTKAQVEYINNQGLNVLPDIYPVGAATQNLDSGDITEMYDMHLSGAMAYSNGDNHFRSSGALSRALMYSREFGGVVMTHAIDEDLKKGASVNESETTIHTGLKQQPDLAETSQVKKEIDIAQYAEAPIHFSHISSAKTVDLIRAAKAAGYPVTCDVSIWHLIYTDENVLEYDSNFKVTPPFRTESDRHALIAAVNDGTIDAIVSDHNPRNVEEKKLEFDYAQPGINGLQTFYSAYNHYLSNDISLETMVERCAFRPRTILNLSENEIAVGETANLMVANPDQTWDYNKSTNLSKSANNPLFGKTLTGKCTFVVNGWRHLDFS